MTARGRDDDVDGDGKSPGVDGDEDLLRRWRRAWPDALETWSRFTKLGEPTWCFVQADEKREHLVSSFAMIRLTDYRVVISLRQIRELGLEDHAREVLAHEIGHHVYAPANLRDNARLAARIRAGLPSREQFTGLIANLYTDLLINDRLQRSYGYDMAGIYEKIRVEEPSSLWQLYMRIFERLWRLPSNTLVQGPLEAAMEGDADLGSRLIRAYAREWLDGAGRFACLFLPYTMKEKDEALLKGMPPLLDTMGAGSGDLIPDGLVEVDEGEESGAIHPADDPELSGIEADEAPDEGSPAGGGVATKGGRKNNYRDPSSFVDLMRAVGVTLPEEVIVARYYRERALPHLIPFPTRTAPQSTDPLPEGLDTWDVGSPLADVDWIESLIRSPTVIPGVTTVERTYGTTAGGAPERLPVDLYLGIDCSGSMPNPRFALSYPVLAGTIITLSALRVGASVMACLSGESPGKFSQTDGFIRDERAIMKILTGYLGTGYAFGIERLNDTFVKGPTVRRPTHILVVSDSDLFYMLKRHQSGWDIAAASAELAGGGATAVLQIPHVDHVKADIAHLRDCGWNVHLVDSMEEVVAFARAFAKMKYDVREGETR